MLRSFATVAEQWPLNPRSTTGTTDPEPKSQPINCFTPPPSHGHCNNSYNLQVSLRDLIDGERLDLTCELQELGGS